MLSVIVPTIVDLMRAWDATLDLMIPVAIITFVVSFLRR